MPCDLIAPASASTKWLRRRRYWRLVRPDSNTGGDPNQGRIFFEDHVSGEMALLGDEDALQALTGALMERVGRPIATSFLVWMI